MCLCYLLDRIVVLPSTLPPTLLLPIWNKEHPILTFHNWLSSEETQSSCSATAHPLWKPSFVNTAATHRSFKTRLPAYSTPQTHTDKLAVSPLPQIGCSVIAQPSRSIWNLQPLDPAEGSPFFVVLPGTELVKARSGNNRSG
ncbi:hypothetical protein VHEMI00381 [[Torrubiella] hemipterigena]|uniref:Uncharacterized protein n=1 Tax=[Torrubiella] hemipterigena TaxID=1531966 RepID=A0A0A1T286_9HYPO|nr:hypothetical protein VHEMI00381 [[Torrubiella] hemipterigena]